MTLNTLNPLMALLPIMTCAEISDLLVKVSIIAQLFSTSKNYL